MNDYYITFSDELHERIEFRSLHILARGFVGENFIDDDSFKLTGRVLFEGAYADIANAMPFH